MNLILSTNNSKSMNTKNKSFILLFLLGIILLIVGVLLKINGLQNANTILSVAMLLEFISVVGLVVTNYSKLIKNFK